MLPAQSRLMVWARGSWARGSGFAILTIQAMHSGVAASFADHAWPERQALERKAEVVSRLGFEPRALALKGRCSTS